MHLTDTAIRKAKPADKVQRLFDAGGLYLEIAKTGGKWWRLKYRFDGKEKRLSLGTYPDTSLASARDKRDAEPVPHYRTPRSTVSSGLLQFPCIVVG